MSIKTTVRRTVTTALAAAVLAPVLTLLAAGSAVADARTDIRDLARANLGKQTCSTNSLGGVGYMDSCRMAHAWCADFARWVWNKAGLHTDRLTPAAGSFYLYGVNNGTLHTDSGYVPQIGDAVVLNYQGNGYADHVSIVDAVTATSMTTINGNSGGSGPTTSSVQYATGGHRVGQYIGGQRISAFVSPAGIGTTPALAKRLGVLGGGGAVIGKQGELDAGWTPVHGGGIVKAKFDGDMVGVVDAGGTLHVKQGDMYQGWFPQIGNVKDFALESATGRIGVLRNDGTVTVKEGGLQGGWVEQYNGVAELALSGDWIGVVSTNGTVSVKQGNLYAGWTTQVGNAKHLELDAAAGRIGVLRNDGSVVVKDGGLYGTNWVEQTSGVTDFELSGDWIGVVFANGLASVKAGGLQAGWTNQLSGVKDVELDAAAGRLGFLRTDGTLAAKDGGLYGTTWHEVANGVTTFDVTSY
ncbi:CHAP domain-containing protein [Saccharothrix luteola]|uniref:CHAP domain-containing protein n=1 Tax=Saccharothrix luteola TaxID=2893018 RepID=UPI001E3BC544|nr:CHAP domain-containing protein [Saccharothrix luteola]MCC8243835.1 CHAP domain-containing protein [Saccharothrix luteola]